MHKENLLYPKEQFIKERMEALDIGHRVFEPTDSYLGHGGLPAGVTWGCDRDLIPLQLNENLLAEIAADYGFFDAFFIFNSPESKLFAYELKRARDLTLMNDRTGTKAYYSALGQLEHVIERPSVVKNTEFQSNYCKGKITGVMRTRENRPTGSVTLYDANLQMSHHFTSRADFRDFMDAL